VDLPELLIEVDGWTWWTGLHVRQPGLFAHWRPERAY
jgi:hypothetical protein